MSTSTSQATGQTDTGLSKRVQIVEKDSAQQIVRGAVLVPNELDHQGDFLRADTIASLREGFVERMESGHAFPGVMHAVFPRDDLKLEDDTLLESETSIGGKTLPEGTWVQTWKVTDAELWALVEDGVLGGQSIGGRAKGAIYPPGELPDDVSIPDAVQARLEEENLTRDDIRTREITSGRIDEMSQVDMPAVPGATYAEAKAADLSKASPMLTDNIVSSFRYLTERGHDPDDALRLAEYLQDRKSMGKTNDGFLGRAKSFFGFDGGDRGDAHAGTHANESAKSDTRTSAEHPSDTDTKTTSEDEIMTDELNETLDELASKLDSIDEKLAGDADGDGNTDPEKNTDGDADGDTPSLDEKVDTLADATTKTVEQVEQIAEQVEQMATAQGVSQQADTGTANGSEKTWDNSPFAGGDA